MIHINKKYRDLLLEAIEDLLYKVSVRIQNASGQELRSLTKKQKDLEQLQGIILAAESD